MFGVSRVVFGLFFVLVATLFAGGCFLQPDGALRFLSADPGFGDRFALGPDAVAVDADGAPEGDGGAEREVVEPDVIRQAGKLLFVLNQYRGLSIVDLDTEELLSQTPTYGFPRDLYLVGDRAYVLVGQAGEMLAEGNTVRFNLGSRLYVLDVADTAAPKVVSTFDLAGDFVDSRLVGNVLYAVSAEFSWQYDGVVVFKQQTSSSWVSSINIANPADIHVVDTLDFAGYGSVIQSTNFALFVAASDWESNTAPITYIDISDPNGAIAVRGTVAVPGYVPDRFKMDAYQGVLRVVSSTGWPEPVSYITTVDLSNPDALAILGQSTIEGTENETLFATRFDGPRGYVVTYFIIDPLFVLDLSDPAEPKVTGVLEVPGWSTHIEPRGDRLIALGVDDTNGRRVSVSIFDVADPAAPALLDRASFGENWSWSTAHNDVKAFTVLEDTLIVPFSGWNYEAGGFDRLQFVHYADDKLTLQGHVDLEGQILRSFRLGNRYYGVTSEEVAVISGGDAEAKFAVENRITLAENVSDIVELENGAVVSVVSKYNKNVSVFRAEDASGNTLSTVELPEAWFDAVHVRGDTVVVTRQRWEERAYTEVTLLDFSDPSNPVVGAPIAVDITPAYWWGPWIPRGEPVALDAVGVDVEPGVAASGAQRKDIWYPWFPGESGFIAGDYLVLHGWSDKVSATVGGEEANTALAVVNLSDGTVSGVVGLGLPNVQKVAAADGLVYVSYKEQVNRDVLGRSYSAHFMRSFDPATLALGTPANVPGVYLSYNPTSGLLVLEDFQYTPDFNVRRLVRTVFWDGGTGVQVGGQLSLGSQVGQLYAHGARVYFDHYDGGYSLGSIAVRDNGALSFGPRQHINGVWAWFIGADGDTACLSLGGRALARYDFSGPEPKLRDLTPVMQSPYKLRIGKDVVYFPIGYAGALELPR